MGLLVPMFRVVVPASVVDWVANFQLCRSTFSTQERRDYINAVLHLQTLPSKLDPKLFPGARTRYDDFVGVHINQTLSIHFTVRFLFYQIC
jgi:hypothetical protein